MSITNIQYGSLASSEVINNNFTYLDNRISYLAGDVNSATATLNSNIATINGNISSMNEYNDDKFNEIDTSLGTINQIITDSGLYVDLYINGNSWYREYFSDSDKTQRVWLEQGGSSSGTSTTSFIKTFESEPTILVTTYDVWGYASAVTSPSVNGFTTAQWQTAGGGNTNSRVKWVAFGK